MHIVSMFESIKQIPYEVDLFKEQMPRVVLTLMPIWKKRLYSPKTNKFFSVPTTDAIR